MTPKRPTDVHDGYKRLSTYMYMYMYTVQAIYLIPRYGPIPGFCKDSAIIFHDFTSYLVTFSLYVYVNVYVLIYMR